MKRSDITTPELIKRLQRELKNLRQQRILGICGSILCPIIFMLRLSYGNYSVSTYGYLLMTVLFLGMALNLGSIRLRKGILQLQPLPTQECVSLLLECMAYVSVRKNVADKLEAILPLLSLDQLGSIERRLWVQLYRHYPTFSNEMIQQVFSLAVLLADKQAIPYLKRVLDSDRLPDDIHLELSSKLNKLEGACCL